jgi:hypothetical protein
MDPNTALAILRDPNAPLADRLEAAGYLDGWISKGGFLPEAWNGQPDGEKQYLACDPCGEVFDTIATARAHEFVGENGFYGHEYTIIPESEAF